MAQHDYVIANQGFPAFRSDLNDALAAIVSNNSGATEPTTMFAHQMWVDTAADPSILKIRNADNDAWITIGTINQTGDTFTLTSAVSATTLNTSGAVVFNDAGANVDFRVEGDTNANLLFVDASADKVGVGTNAPSRELAVNGRFIAAPSAYGGDYTAGTNAVIGARQTSTTDVVSAFTGNTNAQGTAQFNRIVERYPVVSSGTKLIIPFVSQGSLNSGTICRLMGHGARFNSTIPLGFTINFAVGHLTNLANLASWGGGGNYSSIAINGMNIEITFTTAYTSATSNGLYLDLEYMTNNFGLSIDVANIAMN